MGFETTAFLSQPVGDDICCPLCLEVFENPVTTCLEGHVLCNACFEKLQRQPKGVNSGEEAEEQHNTRNSDAKTAGKCPQCREDLVDTALRNRPLQSIISKLSMRCESRSICADDGSECAAARTCTWEGTVEQYVCSHRPSCEHSTFVSCEVCADRIRKCCIEAHGGSAECRAARAQIRRSADTLVDALEASGETVEEKAEVLLEALISDDVWPTSLRLGEDVGVTYMSPEEYSLIMASTEMGRMISTLFDGKEEITEEEARTFFVKCMLGRMHDSGTEEDTEG